MVDSDIGFKEKSSYYDKSKNFKTKKTIKVFLENFHDSRLWIDAFPDSDEFQIDFTTLTVAENRHLVDSASDGCQKLQELSEQYELGNNLIICLDSDFSYIRSVLNSTENSYDRDYIFQTYSHSIENAKYYEDFIVESISRYIIEDPYSEKFSFIYDYYREISKAIFYPFVKTLILKNLEDKSITAEDNIMKILSKFKDISVSKKHSYKDFSNNPNWISIKQSLSVLNVSLDAEISSKGIDFDSILEKLSKNNINEDNIYLFVRGHDLAAMLHKHIINFYESLFKEKCDEICNGHTDGKLKSECKAQFFNNKPNFSLTEKKDLSKHPFMSKTVSRISKMFTNSLT